MLTTLPNDCIIDATMVSYDADLPGLRLLSLAVAGDGSTVTFTFRAGAGTDLTLLVPGVFTGIYEGRVSSSGPWTGLLRVEFGEGVPVLAANPTYRGNTYTFTDAYLEPSVQVQQLYNRVSSVNSQVGLIYFTDGYNSTISLLKSQNVLRIAAAVGSGLGVSCDPLPGQPKTQCGESIYYINGQHPNWLGQFSIRGGDGLTVDTDPVNHKIILSTGINPNKPACKDP